MCGRIVLKAPARQVAQEFELPVEPVLGPARHNIAPGQPVAAVRLGRDGEPVGGLLRWGLLPPWARAPRDGDRLFNARSETADAKPAFAEAFARRRCLVPVDGFYEWRRRGAARLPHYFSGADGRLLALAGLWSAWRAGDGAVVESCAVLTTAANGLVGAVHDRMPAILAGERRRLWLTAPPARAGELRDLLRPAPEDLLRVWPVGAAVNRADAEGPDLCAPLPAAAPRQLDLF